MVGLVREDIGQGEYLSVHHGDEQDARDDAPHSTAIMLIGAARRGTGDFVRMRLKRMNLSETIQRVIDLSTVVKHETEKRREEHPLERRYDPLREKRKPSDAEKSLNQFLYAQPVAVLYTMVLVMYAGRGDFEIKDFMRQYEEMRNTFDKPGWAINQMTEKVPLPDYLKAGLEGLAKQKIDVDALLELRRKRRF
jgi:hypothetical protein